MIGSVTWKRYRRGSLERHNIELGVVFDTRRKLLGNWARDPDWWLKPRHVKVLRSGITLREIGEELDISISHAKHLRDRALALQSEEWDSLPSI